METRAGVDMETSEGGLKELVLRWFTETQAPLVNGNGNFPDWFQGFTARKEAEDLLRDKPLGSFLIRLSDKAVGYILSYKGHDRCRHFVITQNQDGQFVIAGDSQTFGSLTELIEHYRVSPILPFGEYLTSSCREENEGALYDVVNYNPRVKPGVSVQALRSLWDQKQDHQSHSDNTQRIQPRHDLPAAPPPALPLKSKSRKLTGTVSADAMTLSQVVPPVPKRGLPLGFSLSGSLPETTSHPSETQTDSHRPDRLNGNPDRDSLSGPDSSYPCDLCPPGNMYSELIRAESRSKSLPKLNNNERDEEEEEEDKEEEVEEKEVKEKEEENSNRLSSSSFTSHSPSPLRRVTCHTYSLHDPRDGPRPSSARSELQGDDLEMLRFNPLYQTSEGPGGGRSAPRGGAMYAEVPRRPSPAALPDDTYEQIPGEAAAAVQGNTYESLEDLKTKKSKSTWGKNNINWKKFLPDYKKK